MGLGGGWKVACGSGLSFRQLVRPTWPGGPAGTGALMLWGVAQGVLMMSKELLDGLPTCMGPTGADVHLPVNARGVCGRSRGTGDMATGAQCACSDREGSVASHFASSCFSRLAIFLQHACMHEPGCKDA